MPNEPIMIMGDALRLEQVMVNLLSNAVKYNPSSGPIQVQVARTAANAVVEVVDRGLGIPADALAHVFTPFYRASNGETRTHAFGLGLHVVQEIVQQHGGRVEVDSTEGHGSTFRIAFPHAPLT